MSLNEQQVEIVAMYLATSNLGQPISRENALKVRAMWRACQVAHASEGIEVGDELDVCKRTVWKGSKYIMGVINNELPWVLAMK